MKALLELADVSVHSMGATLLEDVSLTLVAGRTTCVIGPSGSGKSILLKTMAALIPADEGQVLFEGRPLGSMSSEELRRFRLRTGYVFQDAALWQNMSLLQNLTLPLKWSYPKLSDETVQARVHRALEAVGYHDNLNVRPADLATGAQKVIGFARCLAMDPDLYFLDAPLSLLDGAAANRLIGVTHELKREGKTLVAVMNNLDFCFQIADDLCILNGGRVHSLAPLEESLRHWPSFLNEITPFHWDVLKSRGISPLGGLP